MSEPDDANRSRWQSVTSESETHPDPFCELCCPIRIQKTCRITKTKWSTAEKVIVLTVTLIFVSISTAFAIRFYRLQSQILILGAGDQRPVATGDGDFSAKFCSNYGLDLGVAPANAGVTAHTNQMQSHFNAYLLLDDPKRSKVLKYQREYKLELYSPSDYQYWAYYMDAGSQLQMDLICDPSSDIAMYIIKGDDRFYEWTNKVQHGHECSGCVYDTHIFTKCAGSQSSTEKYTFHVSSSKVDEYIFIFQVNGPSENSVLTNIVFFMHRINLVVEDVYDQCNGVQHCTLSVPNKARTIVLEMLANASVSSVSIETRCLPEVGMYFAFFFAVPLALWLIIAVLVFALWKCHRQVLQDVQNADNARAMLRLHNQRAPRYTTGTEQHNETDHVGRLASGRFRPFRTNPSSYRIPLVQCDVSSTATENDTLSRSLPSYQEVTDPSPNAYPGRESSLELFATTPPPDYDPTSRNV